MAGNRLAGPSGVGRFFAWLLTFVAVVVGWVFFRAADFDAAMRVLAGMSGVHGISIPNAIYVRLGPLADILGDFGVTSYLGGGRQFVLTYLWVISLLVVALVMPNTQQIMRRYRPALARHRTPPGCAVIFGQRVLSRVLWKPTSMWAIAIGSIAAFGLLALTSVSEFLYFQF